MSNDQRRLRGHHPPAFTCYRYSEGPVTGEDAKSRKWWWGRGRTQERQRPPDNPPPRPAHPARRNSVERPPLQLPLAPPGAAAGTGQEGSQRSGGPGGCTPTGLFLACVIGAAGAITAILDHYQPRSDRGRRPHRGPGSSPDRGRNGHEDSLARTIQRLRVGTRHSGRPH